MKKKNINCGKLLEAEPFTGWTGGNKKGYLTACTSIKKKAEKLLQEQANCAEQSDSNCNNPLVINWLVFADVQPVHEQPIVYWRGGYKLGKWNGETKTMWDGSPKPKVWYPLPTCL